MRYTHIIAVTALSLAAVDVAGAQGRIRVESPRAPGELFRGSRVISRAPDRPQLGIAVASEGRGDSLGVLVDDVTRDSPAEHAGIKEGDRLQSINGTSLRLSAADAAEEDMAGVATRRLLRELDKMKVGDVATLGVYRDGKSMTVKVTTASAAELSPIRSSLRVRDSERAAIGLGLSATGSRRDTAGVLIASVVDDGPADKARIEEGDRISAVNGVDLRVPSEDAGDAQVSSMRLRRFYKEIENLKAGDQVELRLIRGGQSRTVKVTAVAASDLPKRSGFSFSIGEGDGANMWFGGNGITEFAMPRGGGEGNTFFFERNGEGNSGRSIVIPRNRSNGGVYFFDKDGTEGSVELQGRLRDLIQRYQRAPSARRLRINTPAANIS